MRVLMFGWEFPPHISGGLGTACFGITNGLLEEGVDVLFVVPKLFGNEDRRKFSLVSASEIDINAENPFVKNLIGKLNYLQVHSSLIPYHSPDIYSTSTQFLSSSESASQSSSFRFSFKGEYGRDILSDIGRYSIVASEIARQNSFDVIHAHDWLTFPAGIAAKEITGKPLIVHVHATEYDRSGENINPDVFEIEKRGMDTADRIISVSEFTRQILINKYGITPDKIQVVHNALIEKKSEEINTNEKRIEEKVVTFMGRVTYQKGPDYFIEAAKKVLERFPETRFVMAGSGDMLQRMIHRAAELKIGSRFHFTGFLRGKDVEKMYAISDVYVMPSVSEPFGIAPLEAMQQNVPVIISKQSGVSEVIKNAIKIDFWDVDAMADSICVMLNYSSLKKTFAENGKKEASDLKWNDSAKKIKKIYHHLSTV